MNSLICTSIVYKLLHMCLINITAESIPRSRLLGHRVYVFVILVLTAKLFFHGWLEHSFTSLLGKSLLAHSFICRMSNIWIFLQLIGRKCCPNRTLIFISTLNSLRICAPKLLDFLFSILSCWSFRFSFDGKSTELKYFIQCLVT